MWRHILNDKVLHTEITSELYRHGRNRTKNNELGRKKEGGSYIETPKGEG